MGLVCYWYSWKFANYTTIRKACYSPLTLKAKRLSFNYGIQIEHGELKHCSNKFQL